MTTAPASIDITAFAPGSSLGVPPSLSIVVPCYNEQAVLPESVKSLSQVLSSLIALGQISATSKIWLVDDGSTDETWPLIDSAARSPDSPICGIKLSRNRGHQIALLAGLLNADGDIVISVDADLQDDLSAIPTMVAKSRQGFDIVYGVRAGRHSDSAFKRLSAEAYYRFHHRIGVEIVLNHADYRLMSRRALEALRAFPESNLFLRGLVPQLGFASTTVPYERAKRFAGQSKYPLTKMLALAWQGVTSFSVLPLRAITALGAVVSMISLGLGAWALFVRLFTENVVPGWASIVIPLFLISGIQLLSLGIIGEYVAKIFLETKRRPLYFVDKIVRPGGSPDAP